MSINVNKPFLPPLDEFLPYLEEIWSSKILTNNGPKQKSLEDALCKRFKISHVSLVNNGTSGLLLAFKALEIENSEIITTPFTFIGTSNSIVWANNKPVFVDIEKDFVNLDPSKIEEAITPNTKAILAVHCYGYPCQVKKISEIASKRNLKVIYDAAHAFDVEIDSESILKYGDIAVISFHATKTFHTFEGGAIISRTKEMKHKINRLKNFGFENTQIVKEIGFNGKLNEISASMGLLQLKYYEKIWNSRKEIDELYRKLIGDIQGIEVIYDERKIRHNFSYFPIKVSETYPISRDDLLIKLKEKDIYARAYFYPLISNINSFKDFKSAQKSNLPNANDLSSKIICLPIYPDMGKNNIYKVCKILKDES